MTFILLVIVALVAFVKISHLSNRITVLEKHLERSGLVDKISIGDTAQAEPLPKQHIEGQMSAVAHAMPTAQTTATPTAQTYQPAEPSAFTVWISENWLSKIGVLLILIGFGWFISYAFVHDWISPVGRVTLGMSVGIILLAVGAFRIVKNGVQGYTLITLGAALTMITIYAARIVYDFFTPTTALLFIFIIAASVVIISWRHDQEKLAVFGVLIGLSAPIFVRVSQLYIPELFIYLAVVSIASVWVAFVKGWGTVSIAAILGALVYTAPIMLAGNASMVTEADKTIVIVVTLLLALVYFAVNVLQVIRLKDAVKEDTAAVAMLNAILVTAVILGLVKEEFQSLLFVAWMIIFISGSLLVSVHTEKMRFFYIYASVAILFLGLATARQFDGPVLTIAFMLEAVIVTLITFLITKKLAPTASMAWLLLLPAVLTLPSLISTKWNAGVMHQDAAILSLMAVLLFTVGLFLMQLYKKEMHDEMIRTTYVMLNVIGAFFTCALIWLAAGALLESSVAVIASLSLYTIIGVTCYIAGTFTNSDPAKYFGAILVCVVVGRLLLIDVWLMSLAPRIVMFILIGILLVSTAFIGKTKGTDA